MTANLIQTKLHVPAVSNDFVERPYLIQKLNQLPDRHLTLVAAPAGFGKTTLIASWLAKQPQPHGWVSLDEFDNDLALFLQYVVTAVQQQIPEAFAHMMPILQAPDLPTYKKPICSLFR